MTKRQTEKLCQRYEETFGEKRPWAVKATADGNTCLGCIVRRELEKKPKERNAKLIERGEKAYAKLAPKRAA